MATAFNIIWIFQPSEVIPISGEPLRFHVASRSRKTVHLVDLEEYDMNGACSCEHFAFTLQPLLESGAKNRNTRCYHIQRARDYLCDKILRQVAQQINETKNYGTKRKAG
jgi:hypothetical protein